ncbi:MAG: hypothetical protein WBA23_20260 [Tunicatimonas sp.]|uniref:hypothetical protein n=1 Tax=Tunicatimonas sp. TaxID=1940096 RepID=UPI003C775D26
MNEQEKTEYINQLTRYLSNPSAAKERYEASDFDGSLEEYTQQLQKLADQLAQEDFDDKDALCQQVKTLHLPGEQFNC